MGVVQVNSANHPGEPGIGYDRQGIIFCSVWAVGGSIRERIAMSGTQGLLTAHTTGGTEIIR